MNGCGRVRLRGASQARSRERAVAKADRCWLQATDPGASPELGKADTRSGEGPGSVACSTRHLSKFSAGPENLHGARSAYRIQRRVRHQSHPPFRRTSVSPPVIVAAPAGCMRRTDSRALARIRSWRRLTSGRSGTFPRARVCLSKLGERLRIDRLQSVRVRLVAIRNRCRNVRP